MWDEIFIGIRRWEGRSPSPMWEGLIQSMEGLKRRKHLNDIESSPSCLPASLFELRHGFLPAFRPGLKNWLSLVSNPSALRLGFILLVPGSQILECTWEPHTGYPRGLELLGLSPPNHVNHFLIINIYTHAHMHPARHDLHLTASVPPESTDQ